MRGVEQVTNARIYVSDRDTFAKAIAVRNIGNEGKRLTFADGFRLLKEENLRMRQENGFLNLEIARLKSILAANRLRF